ncbi:MAG: hypothetical protein IT438_00320 [Phycisphaerales bacterium]|nr:hypothetical protein [Phycisphaerales bacterium]
MPKNYGSSKPTLATLMPQNKKDRVKLFSAIGVTAVCLVWLIIYAISSMGPGAPKPADTPGWKIAQELNAKLAARPDFNDVGFDVASEKPLRFKLVGMVHDAKKLDSLKTYLGEIRPEADYDLEVTILGQ